MKNFKIAAASALLVSVLALGGCQKTSTLVGFDIDLAREVATELNVNVQFTEIVWEQKELELSSKNIDLIWNGFTITPERQAALSFSIPYMENKQVVIAKKSVSSLSATTAYKVAVEAGSAGSDAFDADTLYAKSTKIEVTDQISALTEVLSGSSDLAIIDAVMAGYYLAEGTSYAATLKILSDYEQSAERYGIGARKGDDALVAKINGALADSYNNGKTKTIADKYGLADVLVAPSDFATYSSISDTSSWDAIVKKGTLVVGYTVFAPIAYLG